MMPTQLKDIPLFGEAKMLKSIEPIFKFLAVIVEKAQASADSVHKER